MVDREAVGLLKEGDIVVTFHGERLRVVNNTPVKNSPFEVARLSLFVEGACTETRWSVYDFGGEAAKGLVLTSLTGYGYHLADCHVEEAGVQT
jgi:hypothetical protein